MSHHPHLPREQGEVDRPVSSILPFLKPGVTFAFLQSSGTSPSHHNQRLLRHQGPCPTQQWAHIFPSFPFSAYILTEALVALDMPRQTQLQALAFLTVSLQARPVSLCSSQVTWLIIHPQAEPMCSSCAIMQIAIPPPHLPGLCFLKSLYLYCSSASHHTLSL